MRRLLGILPAIGAALALTLAACGASATPTPTSPAGGGTPAVGGTPASGGGGGGASAKLAIQVNFTGTDTVQGSFATTDWQIYSCSDFAKSSLAWGIGVGPQEGVPTTVGGKLVNFLLSVSNSSFHGPATYTDVMPAGVTVEGDDFAGSGSTMTINGDGSGNASFTDLSGSGNVSGQSESGTVTWTCG